MNKKIFVFGDSITWGAFDNDGGWVARVKKDIDEKMIASNLDYYVPLYNLGISGDTTREVLERFDEEIQRRIQPDDEQVAIIFAIGINDSQINEKKEHAVELAQFQKNLHQLLQKAQGYAEEVLFVGLTPVDEALTNPTLWMENCHYLNEEIEKYDQAVRNFCEETNVPFIDILPDFQKEDYKKLLIDGLHPNTKGHEKIYNQIKIFLDNTKWV